MTHPETKEPPLFDLEPVYDEKIAPLMTQIIAICKEHNLPMLATFFYQRTEDNGEGLCTTALLGREFAARDIPKKILEAERAITAGRNISMFRTTVTNSDGTTETTLTAVIE